MELQISVPCGSANLAATVHYPLEGGSCGKWPLVILCHGFVGNRIGADRLFVETARDLSAHGFMAIRFDYGAGEFDSLVEQTIHMVDYGLRGDYVDPNRVTLLGHSLGGAVALNAAARDRRVKTLIMWSAERNPDEKAKRFKGDVLLIQESSDETNPADYANMYQKFFWTRTDGMCDKIIIQEQSRLIMETTQWLATLEKRKEEWNDWTI